MIELKKEVRRKAGKYVLALCPPLRDEPALLKIREHRRRFRYEVTLDTIYWVGARKAAEKAERRGLNEHKSS